mmetsp:Transcript_33929/g.71235  ORF Transcript_33929/g.71235 Transcript_33929/m.71235 type:complete len:296 (-) Transcript_33929:748-1635(-)
MGTAATKAFQTGCCEREAEAIPLEGVRLTPNSGRGEPGAELSNLAGDGGPRGAALRLPPLHRRLVVPHAAGAGLGRIVAEERVQGTEVVGRELVQGAAPLLRHLDDGARDVVGLAEGHALADQVVRQVRREHRQVERREHLRLVRLERRHHPVGNLAAGSQSVRAVEQRLLVLLKVLVVRGGRALDSHEETHSLPDRPARLAAQELQRIGVLLLRHQRAARGVGVGQRDEAEFRGAVQDQILSEAAHVQHDHARGEEELDDEISISNRIEAVLNNTIEAEISGQRLPVDAERMAR